MRAIATPILATLILATLSLSGCIDTATVLDAKPLVGGEPTALAAEAERTFAAAPRTEDSATRAFDLMREAAQNTDVGSPQRLRRLVLAARYAVWGARHGTTATTRSELADAAIVICNTAIRDAPDCVEGYYYRAIATGLFARENTVYGVDAMGQIRDDARRAIALDPTYDDAGPHRVLGGLYLEAPGPPSGIGSLRRALRELEIAVGLAPDHPDNALLLAKAYLDADQQLERVADLLARLPTAIDRAEDELERDLWCLQLTELRRRFAER